MARSSTTSNAATPLSAFARFVGPIVTALKELGNSGRAGEVTSRVIAQLGLSDAELEATTASGQPRVRNQIGWARFYLVKAGYIDRTERGVWRLTEIGAKAKLGQAEVSALVKAVNQGAKTASEQPMGTALGDEQLDPDLATDYRTETLMQLRAMTPSGFEHFCQFLLRESGFDETQVTGKSGDGGIDGHGLLRVSPFVTFKVLFQCKRYAAQNKVGASQVRDFRGGMQGAAEKGLIITTSDFTHAAIAEANRPGGLPIQLVNGDDLVALLADKGLGLKPVTTYEIDPQFFRQWQSDGAA